MTSIREQVIEWLHTFSQVDSMKENPSAVAKEIDTITAVFTRNDATPAMVDETFRSVKMNVESRAWPTAAQVFTALKDVRRSTSGEAAIGSQRGDRDKLNSQERALLDQVLKTARRWLREFPNLRHHAMQTLEYWSEPLVDDWNKSHEKKKDATQ